MFIPKTIVIRIKKRWLQYLANNPGVFFVFVFQVLLGMAVVALIFGYEVIGSNFAIYGFLALTIGTFLQIAFSVQSNSKELNND